MIDNVVVHVLDKSIFKYLGMNHRIVEHGENLPREQFLAILGSMDLNLYMSFNESWGLVAKESEAMGVKTISNLNLNYMNAMRLKLDK
jgi:glycosyltransferase involved in cell wall biosynthesis